MLSLRGNTMRINERRLRSIIRAYVAKNPNTLLEVLISLAGDESKMVRNFLAVNKTYQKYLASQKQITERWIRLAGLLN